MVVLDYNPYDKELKMEIQTISFTTYGKVIYDTEDTYPDEETAMYDMKDRIAGIVLDTIEEAWLDGSDKVVSMDSSEAVVKIVSCTRLDDGRYRFELDMDGGVLKFRILGETFSKAKDVAISLVGYHFDYVRHYVQGMDVKGLVIT